jgi:hypothetical protein
MKYTTLINTDDDTDEGNFTEGKKYVAQDNFVLTDNDDVDPHQYETRDDNGKFIGRLDMDNFRIVESHYSSYEKLGKK